MYKAFVVAYSPAADRMAELVEQKANEVVRDGYEVVSFSVTNSARAIILARRREDFPKERAS
ncbi:hypothetical protein [Parafannyhessea umbonata]|uniref:hypothetical protein n=1 Tax=Parafannyhessea umbonata TaxID=604330 RepID=UPI00359C4BF1